jgi:hypothetical protein
MAKAQDTITVEEIAAIERLLMQYHAAHADSHGPIEVCTEPTCCEAKTAIMWLVRRAAEHAPHAPGAGEAA